MKVIKLTVLLAFPDGEFNELEDWADVVQDRLLRCIGNGDIGDEAAQVHINIIRNIPYPDIDSYPAMMAVEYAEYQAAYFRWITRARKAFNALRAE